MIVKAAAKTTIYDDAVNALRTVVNFFDRACEAVATEDTLREIQKACWQTAEDHGFHDVGQTFGDKIALIHSEASEALEDFRAGKQPAEVWYEGKGAAVGHSSTLKSPDKAIIIEHSADGAAKPCGIPSEIADIVIRCFDMAEGYGIDLQDIIREKMTYNESREYLHGKKF